MEDAWTSPLRYRNANTQPPVGTSLRLRNVTFQSANTQCGDAFPSPSSVCEAQCELADSPPSSSIIASAYVAAFWAHVLRLAWTAVVCRPKMNMDRLVAEIGETRTFLASRAQHSDGSRGAAALARRLAEGMASQIRQARTFGSSEVARLLDALSDDPYGFEGTAVVVAAVDNRLNTEGTNGRRASATQKLLHVYNYLTQEDWRKLRDPSCHCTPRCMSYTRVSCGAGASIRMSRRLSSRSGC